MAKALSPRKDASNGIGARLVTLQKNEHTCSFTESHGLQLTELSRLIIIRLRAAKLHHTRRRVKYNLQASWG